MGNASYPTEVWHASDSPIKSRLSIEKPLHAGTREQALMRRPKGFLHKIVLKTHARTTVMKDTGSWNETRLAKAKARADIAITLNRYEGIDASDLEMATFHDASPDSLFRKMVPSAKDSLIILNPDIIRSITVES